MADVTGDNGSLEDETIMVQGAFLAKWFCVLTCQWMSSWYVHFEQSEMSEDTTKD